MNVFKLYVKSKTVHSDQQDLTIQEMINEFAIWVGNGGYEKDHPKCNKFVEGYVTREYHPYTLTIVPTNTDFVKIIITSYKADWQGTSGSGGDSESF